MRRAIAGLTVLAALAPDACAQVIWSVRFRFLVGQEVVRFPVANPADVTVIGDTGLGTLLQRFVSGVEFTPDGRLWANVQSFVGDSGAGLYSVNKATGEITHVGFPSGLTDICFDLAWNPSDQRMYAVAQDTVLGGTAVRIYRVNLETGAYTLTRNLTAPSSVVPTGLVCDAAGVFYIQDVVGNKFYRQDGSALVALGNQGFDANMSQGVGFDYLRPGGAFWHVAFNNTTSRAELWQVNLSTGVGTFVDRIGPFDNSTHGDGGIEPFGGCQVDYNGDGTVDFFDYLDFVEPFSADDPRADYNRDGQVDFFDYLDFTAAFAAGGC